MTQGGGMNKIQELINKLRIVYLPDPEDADYLDVVLRQAADTIESMQARIKDLEYCLGNVEAHYNKAQARIELLEKVVEAGDYLSAEVHDCWELQENISIDAINAAEAYDKAQAALREQHSDAD